MTFNRVARGAAAAALAALAAACSGGTSAPGPGLDRPRPVHPEPRFPSYLKPVSTVEDVLPHVRSLVRTKSGVQGAGLGVANAGRHRHLRHPPPPPSR